MKSIVKQVHPSGEIIVFDKKRHIYYLEGKPDDIFISVTQIVNKFFIKFDMESISRKYAIRNNLCQEDVKKTWRKKSFDAMNFGNRCHDYAYSLLHNYPLPKPKSERESEYFSVIKKTIKRLFKEYDFIGSEFMIANFDHRIAGTVDLLYSNDNYIFIDDWKTSNIIDRYNKFQNALSPISNLSDCRFNKYALQLNLYKFILQSENYFSKCYKMNIRHLKSRECRILQVPDMTNEIEKMLGSQEST